MLRVGERLGNSQDSRCVRWGTEEHRLTEGEVVGCAVGREEVFKVGVEEGAMVGLAVGLGGGHLE